MALPNVVIYNVNPTSSTSFVANATATTSGLFALTTTVLGVHQQRLTISSQADDSAKYFHIVGLNEAGFTVAEFLAGGLGTGAAASAATVQSNIDYRTIISIQPSASSIAQTLATTAGTVSVGINGVGSTLWNIMNWHVTPTNIEISAIVTTSASTVNWGAQYTYDDPNNPPAGQSYAQPFNHPTLNNLTASLDGPINDPVTGVRFIINSGTGTIRGTIIQAGIGSP